MNPRAWELAFCWLVLQILDVITTAAALMHGAAEANPLLGGSAWRMVAIKTVVGLAILAVTLAIPSRHESKARVPLLAGLFLAGAVVTWNVAVLVVIGVAS